MNHSSKAHDPYHDADLSATESSTPFHINNILCTATKTINITNKNHTLKPPTHPSSHLNDIPKTIYEEISAIMDDSQTKFKIHDFSAILTQRLTTNMLNDSIEHEKPVLSANRITERLNTDDNTDLISREIITPESHPLHDNYRSNVISANRPNRKETMDSIMNIEDFHKEVNEKSKKDEGENGYKALVTFQGEQSPASPNRLKYQKMLQRAVNALRMRRMMQLALDDRDKMVQKGVDINHTNEHKSLWKRLKTENINPQSQYLAIWRFFFQVTNILFCLVFPYRLSFRANMTERNLPNILTEIIDGFFFIEILLKFFVALRKPDGTLITNRTLIAMTYFKGTFLLDVIALLPYQYFSGKIAILKLFRVIHLNNIFERMGRLTEILVPFFVKDLTALVKAEFIASLSTIFIVLAIIVHFCSCIWIALGFANSSDELTWLSYLPNLNYDSINSAEITDNKPTVYIASLFITAETLTTVGYGTTNFFTLREQVFSMILLFFGILLFALFFEKIKTLTTLLNQTALLQEQKTDEVNAWLMRIQKASEGKKVELVPYQLIDLMRKALLNNIDNLSWQNLIVDSKQFRELDPTTKNTILNLVIRVMKNKFYIIFRNLSQGCSFEILNNAHSKHFMPGNIIIHKGQDIKGLYLILEGSVLISNKQSSQNFARLGSNSFFGETFLIGTQSSSFYFIAENNVSCLFIKEDDMKRIENSFPQDFRRLKDIAEARRRHFTDQSSRTIIIGSKVNVHNEEEDSDSYVSDQSSSDGDGTDSEGMSDSDDEANKSDLFPMETLVPDLEEISQAPQINEYLKERMEFLEEKLESVKGILKVESEYLWKKSEIYCKKFGKRES